MCGAACTVVYVLAGHSPRRLFTALLAFLCYPLLYTLVLNTSLILEFYIASYIRQVYLLS